MIDRIVYEERGKDATIIDRADVPRIIAEGLNGTITIWHGRATQDGTPFHKYDYPETSDRIYTNYYGDLRVHRHFYLHGGESGPTWAPTKEQLLNDLDEYMSDMDNY